MHQGMNHHSFKLFIFAFVTMGSLVSVAQSDRLTISGAVRDSIAEENGLDFKFKQMKREAKRSDEKMELLDYQREKDLSQRRDLNKKSADERSDVRSMMQKQGPGLSGGGFAFEKTSQKHLKNAIQRLVRRIRATQARDIENIFHKFGAREFSVDQLINLILSVESRPDVIKPKQNSTMQGDLLKFDFENLTSGPKKIIALMPFFLRYDKTNLSNEEWKEIEVLLLHEATHLFGIGLDRDQDATELSEQLMDLLLKQLFNCGNSGSLEDRISDCGVELKVNSLKTFQLIRQKSFQYTSDSFGKDAIFFVDIMPLWRDVSDGSLYQIFYHNLTKGKVKDRMSFHFTFHKCGEDFSNITGLDLQNLQATRLTEISNEIPLSLKKLALAPFTTNLEMGGAYPDIQNMLDVVTEKTDGSLNELASSLGVWMCRFQPKNGLK
jgi:hypothetical protein